MIYIGLPREPKLKTPWTPSDENNHYIIGYSAYDHVKSEHALYHENGRRALIVCSEPPILREFVERYWIDDASGFSYGRVHFGQVMHGMIRGVTHAFNKGSYARFISLLRKTFGPYYKRARDPAIYNDETVIVFGLNPEVDYTLFKKTASQVCYEIAN